MTRGATPCVYRAYDANGVLLYTGHTLDPSRRFLQHRSSAEWWRAVATIEITHVDTLSAARALETGLIRGELPAFNIVGSDEHANRH